MAERTARWEQPGYSEITAARTVDGELEVVFANGDHAHIPLSALEPHVSADVALEIIDEGLAVRFGQGSNAIEISWVRLRTSTDPSYARHLAELDAEEARRLGRRLKALREDRDLGQAELAQSAGLSTAQLSKIEKGELQNDTSTVRRLLHAMSASLGDIAGPNALDVSVGTLIQRVVQAGVPRELATALARAVPRHVVPGFLAEAFAWTKETLLQGVPEIPRLSGAVQFKVPGRQQPPASPLVHLGFSVARLARTAFAVPHYRAIPADPAAIRHEAVDVDRQVTLASLLEWTWDQGIPVLPVSATGDFAAAVFEAGEAPAIIIKDPRKLAVFWLFDLAHELGHVALGHVRHALIDVKPSAEPSVSDLDEQAATDFALELLLPNYRALLEEIRADARGDGVRFKFAVERVANRARVTPGILGIAAAFALPEIGRSKDRWGSATNLAKSEEIGPVQTLSAARRRATLEKTSRLDAILIQTVVLSDSN